MEHGFNTDIREFFKRTHNRQSDSYIFTLYNDARLKKDINTNIEITKIEKKNFVFVIDEINRGEISKIFGELFFSIDPNYRGKKGTVKTQYANLHEDEKEGFYVPEKKHNRFAGLYSLKGDSLKETEMYFVETTGNIHQIKETVKYFQAKFPEHYLVVGLDHTLLPNYYTEKNEIELVANLAKVAIELRKDIHCMVLLVNQLNSDIEERERIVNPALHYPIKRDLFRIIE